MVEQAAAAPPSQALLTAPTCCSLQESVSAAPDLLLLRSFLSFLRSSSSKGCGSLIHIALTGWLSRWPQCPSLSWPVGTVLAKL